MELVRALNVPVGIVASLIGSLRGRYHGGKTDEYHPPGECTADT
jgi:hypothetical protein